MENCDGKNGNEVINGMLGMNGDGQVQRDVFPSAAGVTTAEFDEKFKVWALADAQAWGLPLDPAPDPFVVKWMLRT